MTQFHSHVQDHFRLYPGEADAADGVREHVGEDAGVGVAGREVGVEPEIYTCPSLHVT